MIEYVRPLLVHEPGSLTDPNKYCNVKNNNNTTQAFY